MTSNENELEIEDELVKDFLKTFYKKLGYYPIVVTKNKRTQETPPKALSLEELESYFEPHLPTIYGKKQELKTRCRYRPLPELRFIFSQIARTMRYNLREIGTYLGGRDHTTIVHGLQTFRNLYETDERFKERYHQIVNEIRKRHESSIVDNPDQEQDQSKSDLLFRLLQGTNPA